jgi:two-component system, chemotaxis family, chemotaxis protein CheY
MGTMGIDYLSPVLIVDDQQVTVALVTQIVSRMGFQDVDQASNGEEALSKLQSRRYQLVISDLHMQPMNGLQLLQALRHGGSVEVVPFLMMTVNHTIEPAMAAKRAGASAYLLKPFTPQQLRDKINSVLAKAVAA